MSGPDQSQNEVINPTPIHSSPKTSNVDSSLSLEDIPAYLHASANLFPSASRSEKWQRQLSAMPIWKSGNQPQASWVNCTSSSPELQHSGNEKLFCVSQEAPFPVPVGTRGGSSPPSNTGSILRTSERKLRSWVYSSPGNQVLQFGIKGAFVRQSAPGSGHHSNISDTRHPDVGITLRISE